MVASLNCTDWSVEIGAPNCCERLMVQVTVWVYKVGGDEAVPKNLLALFDVATGEIKTLPCAAY